MFVEEVPPPLLMRLCRRVLRLIPIMSGVTRLSFNPLTNRCFRACRGMVAAEMRNGVKILVDPEDLDGRVVFLFGTSDPKVQATIGALLQPGDVFLDIGANYSSVGILASQIVGLDGHVHLSEPQRELSERAPDAIIHARLSNVSVHAVALLDRDGEMTLTRPAHHSGRGTLVGSQPGWISENVQVRAVAT